MGVLEARQRLVRAGNWQRNMERNLCFQKFAIRQLDRLLTIDSASKQDEPGSLFSYSYAARDLFRFAKSRGWKTVLGQIDPGPEEERIVSSEHERYPGIASRWKPAPEAYWESWREEVELADRIIVNSEWSRECLLKEGVGAEKLEVIPLVYQGQKPVLSGSPKAAEILMNQEQPFRLLFLGQVNLRKGMGRLLEAMRLLKDSPVELVLVGPSEIASSEWNDLPRVVWTGPVPRSEVVHYYQEAHAFILPTLSDGYAITQLEALSQGLPTLASANCGSAVTDGVNGRIFENLNPETIASTILEMKEQTFSDISSPTFGLDELADALTCLS
ncbi:glycosyltransferase family 4 protein [bacterium]|nr:glycosyltransferase family 4 protein [bacterium]